MFQQLFQKTSCWCIEYIFKRFLSQAFPGSLSSLEHHVAWLTTWKEVSSSRSNVLGHFTWWQVFHVFLQITNIVSPNPCCNFSWQAMGHSLLEGVQGQMRISPRNPKIVCWNIIIDQNNSIHSQEQNKSSFQHALDVEDTIDSRAVMFSLLSSRCLHPPSLPPMPCWSVLYTGRHALCSDRSRIVRALRMMFHVSFVVCWAFIFRGRGSIWWSCCVIFSRRRNI